MWLGGEVAADMQGVAGAGGSPEGALGWTLSLCFLVACPEPLPLPHSSTGVFSIALSPEEWSRLPTDRDL